MEQIGWLCCQITLTLTSEVSCEFDTFYHQFIYLRFDDGSIRNIYVTSHLICGVEKDQFIICYFIFFNLIYILNVSASLFFETENFR